MIPSTTNTDDNQVKNTKLKLLPILFSGAFGAFIAAIIDNFTNQSASITAKFLSIFFPNINGSYTQILVALGVGLVGAIVCWIYKPVSKKDAFLRGLTIFAALNIINPYGGGTSSVPGKSVNTPQGPSAIVSPEAENNEASVIHAGLFYYSPPQNMSTNFKPNATITKNTSWISSTKPYTTMASFFNKKIYYKEVKGEELKENQRVEITDFYSIPSRHYTYVKIRYLDQNNQLKVGWIKAGQGSEWWYVQPDDPNSKMFSHN